MNKFKLDKDWFWYFEVIEIQVTGTTSEKAVVEKNYLTSSCRRSE